MKNKEVNFQEAFSEFKEGKEIKSMVSKFRYKIIEGKSMIFSNMVDSWIENELGIFPCEIDGKWIINKED